MLELIKKVREERARRARDRRDRDDDDRGGPGPSAFAVSTFFLPAPRPVAVA
jgi:hypothetical protein